MRAFARWLALTRREKRLVITSALAIAAAMFGVRVARMRRRMLNPHAASDAAKRRLTDADIRDYVTAIERAGRWVPGSTCLTKSVALAWLLRRQGIAAVVRVGVKTDIAATTNDAFEAHAWVEYDGVALGDGNVHTRFLRLI